MEYYDSATFNQRAFGRHLTGYKWTFRRKNGFLTNCPNFFRWKDIDGGKCLYIFAVHTLEFRPSHPRWNDRYPINLICTYSYIESYFINITMINNTVLRIRTSIKKENGLYFPNDKNSRVCGGFALIFESSYNNSINRNEYSNR